MTRRIIIGIGAGIIAETLLFMILPINYVYWAVLVGAFVASLIGNRIISVLVVIIYVLIWKITGLYLLIGYFGIHVMGKDISSVLIDYFMVLLTGVVGGWLGLFINRRISRKYNKKP